MNIAIFTELYPPSVGGQEIRFAEIASLLVERGHVVHVFCINNIKGCPAEESVNGVHVHRYPVATNYQKPRFKSLKRRLGVVIRYGWWCRQQAQQSFDLYLYNEWPLFHVLMAPSEARRKAIIDWCETRSGLVFGFIQKYWPRLSAKNMAVSVAVQHHMQGASGRPFAYLPSGITIAQYRSNPRKDRRGLLYVGRIAEHKNLPLLVRAYEELRRQGYDGPLTIAGTGPGLDEVKELRDKSAYDADINLLGYISDDRKVILLSEAEALVIPSKREGFPRVIAEAMASGLPSVTVDFPDNGSRDVIRHYGVGVVTEGDWRSLAAGIEEALAKWDRYSRVGLAARHSLDWNVVVDDLLELATSNTKGTVNAYAS